MSRGVYLFNRNYGLEYSIQADKLTENYMDANLNGIITGGFTTTDIRDYDQYYYYGVQEDNNFWMYKIRSVVKDNDVIRIHGIHIMYDELQGVVIRDVRPKNKLVSEVLRTILEDTDWTVGTVVVSQKYSGNFYYQSSLQSLYELCAKTSCEFRPVIKYSQGKIVSKEIQLFDTLSGDYGKLFKYGDNLLKVVAETNTDELFTAFIGRGKGEEIYDENGQPTGGYGRKITFKDIDYRNSKDGISVHSPVGQDYIEIKEATAVYGYPTGKPRMCEISFDNIEDKKELADATFDFALENCRPKVQLRATGLQHETVDLGETVTVIGQMDIRFKTRVFKIKKDFLQEKVISFEFGDKLVKSTADRIKADQIAEKEREITEQNYIKAMISMVADTYFNEDGYQYNLEAGNDYDLPAGIYSFDKPIDQNPTKVIYFGAGKLMIAKDKKPDGTWDFSLAMDGEAINANVIRAGVLQGGRVYWDLQNGTFRIGGSRDSAGKLQNPNFDWDGSTLRLRSVDIDLKNYQEIKTLQDGLVKTDRIVTEFTQKDGVFDKAIVNLDKKIENRAKETAESFERTITDAKSGLESSIKQTADGFEIFQKNTNAALYGGYDANGVWQPTYNSITKKIEMNEQGLSSTVKRGGVISAINQSPETVSIDASKIDLTGDVTLKGRFLSETYHTNTWLRNGRIEFESNIGSTFNSYIGLQEIMNKKYATTIHHDIDGLFAFSAYSVKDLSKKFYMVFDMNDTGIDLHKGYTGREIYVPATVMFTDTVELDGRVYFGDKTFFSNDAKFETIHVRKYSEFDKQAVFNDGIYNFGKLILRGDNSSNGNWEITVDYDGYLRLFNTRTNKSIYFNPTGDSKFI